MKILRQPHLRLEQGNEFLAGHARFDVTRRRFRATFIPGPKSAKLVGWRWAFAGLGFGQLFFQQFPAFGGNLIGFLAGDPAQLEQMFEITFTDRLALGDGLIE